MLRAKVKGKLTSGEEYLSLSEFVNNHFIHYPISMSPFEVDYDFNPLNPFDLTPLYQDIVLKYGW